MTGKNGKSGRIPQPAGTRPAAGSRFQIKSTTEMGRDLEKLQRELRIGVCLRQDRDTRLAQDLLLSQCRRLFSDVGVRDARTRLRKVFGRYTEVVDRRLQFVLHGTQARTGTS